MSVDVDRLLALDVSGLLAQLAACRDAGDYDGFWFVFGFTLQSLRGMGYTWQNRERPIAPDDRWRRTLLAEVEAAAAQWPALPDSLSCALVRRLQPPD